MINKLQISGTIELKEGMHIGGNAAFSPIGAVDSPVIKDTLTGDPMIPGSSLKGKMRALLAREYNNDIKSECFQDDDKIKDLFGAFKKSSRLIFSDMILKNWDELEKRGLTSKTEIKIENTISRKNNIAKPRQIERVIRGSKFDLNIIYEAYDGKNKENILEDFKVIAKGFELLTYDYLGGHGSRGYGKIDFKSLEVKKLIGEIDEKTIKECQELLEKVTHNGEV